MPKKNKSETNNEWTSLSESSPKATYNKKNKSETDNQWTSTAKNNVNHK